MIATRLPYAFDFDTFAVSSEDPAAQGDEEMEHPESETAVSRMPSSGTSDSPVETLIGRTLGCYSSCFTFKLDELHRLNPQYW
jgi:hypothetical protein